MRRASALHEDLEQLRANHQRLLDQPIEPEERRALRQRIDNLEKMIREGNEERAVLRRALAARDSTTQHVVTRASAESYDDDDGDAVPAPTRRALIPELSRDVRDAMQSVPPHVSAEAMRTLGQLAAGDVAAWQGVKQAKGTVAPIYFARIGIHHRLVFHIDGGTLHANDLVTREELLPTLKRLRAARRSRGRG